MLRLQFKSFATRMCIYVISFTTFVFAIVIGLFYTHSRSTIIEHAFDHTHGELRTMSSQISSLLKTVEISLNQSVWMIEDNLDKPDSLYRIVEAVVVNNDLIVGSGIAFEPYFYKEKGKYYMPYATGTPGNITKKLLGGQDYDYPCMDWYLIPKLLKQSYWSEPFYDSGGGNFITSTYSKPLYDKQGNLCAIFTANISLSMFTNMVNELKPFATSSTFLISRNGSYLTHPERNKIMNETIFSDAFGNNLQDLAEVGYEMQAGKTGTKEIRLKNESVYAFYTTISNTGWAVCNICPPNTILGKLDSLSTKIILLFLFGIFILFIINNAIIRKVVYPLKAFSLSARDIATGRFDVKLYEARSKDEIKDLHDSLEYMQHSLSTYITELKQTTAAKQRIESELSIAREIQMGMIPKSFPPFPERQDVDLHAILQPAKEVGGDLYDFFIDNNQLYFIIGDVSGKGVPASLFMAIARSLFRTLSPMKNSPAEIVKSMNMAISERNESNMFVTLIVGILDLETGNLKICNAGHNPPILIKPNKEVAYMTIKSHLFVGIMEDHQYEDESFMLEKNSKLFLYTDGVTEAENTGKELYGEEQLLMTLTENASLDVRNTVATVIHSVVEHVQSADASDDLTILIIHYKPDNKSVLL